MWRVNALVLVFANYGIGCKRGAEEHIKNGIAKCEDKDHKGAVEEFTKAIELNSQTTAPDEKKSRKNIEKYCLERSCLM